MLEHLFAGDSRGNALMRLCVDQPCQPVSRRKSLHYARTVLPRSTWEIARNAHIQRPVPLVGHDVDPTPTHDTEVACRWRWRNGCALATERLKYGCPGSGQAAGPGHDEVVRPRPLSVERNRAIP